MQLNRETNSPLPPGEGQGEGDCDQPPSPRPSPGGRGRVLRRRLRYTLALAALTAVLSALFIYSLSSDLTQFKSSKLILDRRGHYLGEVPGEAEQLGYWPLPATLPDRIVTATLET